MVVAQRKEVACCPGWLAGVKAFSLCWFVCLFVCWLVGCVGVCNQPTRAAWLLSCVRVTASHPKVVLATNIAETSITINDCVFVIDSLKLKEMRFNPQSQMSELLECWTSQVPFLFFFMVEGDDQHRHPS